MKITILGGGPAGLYSGLLIKKANPAHDIVIIERNAADVTYGWGVVFSDRTLASFQRADYKSYEQIANQFVIWDTIDVYFHGERLHCGGHVIAGISRKALLNILQKRSLELGISLQFSCEVNDLAELPAYDLLVAADGINSVARRTYARYFKPAIELGKARYIWLGADKVLDAFTFIFRENEHGLFQVHAYPFSGTASTFLLECDEASWLNAGLDKASEAESLAYCQALLAENLDGASLLSNNSKWINFPTLKTRLWHHKNIVLLGDCAHTAHFSIGSGTKLAMEDAIALASSLERHQDLETALNAYEVERKPVVEVFQKAAAESQTYFETIKRYLGLDPVQFAFQLLTRSGRITYDDLKFRDVRFGETVDRWYMQKARGTGAIIAPPPMFAPMRLRGLTIPTRLAFVQRASAARSILPVACVGCPEVVQEPPGNVGLILTELTAVSAEGRITPDSPGIYNAEQGTAWKRIVEHVHSISPTKIALQLGHAGRRGSTRLRSEGLDRPLRKGNWPLLSASPIPYAQQSQVPREMDRAAMNQVRDEFVRAARMAEEAGFDLLHLHFAHGYLLASFLSPLTNLRDDEYGGDLEQRMRFPLQVFDAVRTAWPQDKPVSVALSVTDCVKGGFSVEDAVAVASVLKAHGCDMFEVLAGQATIDSEPAYGRGFLTALSDRLRNEAGVPTLVGGYLTTSDEINTVLAAGRADLCIMEIARLDT
jgi:anthraniloyl-CoA monooxygenase